MPLLMASLRGPSTQSLYGISSCPQLTRKHLPMEPFAPCQNQTSAAWIVPAVEICSVQQQGLCMHCYSFTEQQPRHIWYRAHVQADDRAHDLDWMTVHYLGKLYSFLSWVALMCASGTYLASIWTFFTPLRVDTVFNQLWLTPYRSGKLNCRHH